MSSAPGTPAPTGRPADALVLAVLVIPWLTPFASGPSPAVVPWLTSAACACVLFLVARPVSEQSIAQAWIIAAFLSVLAAALQYFGATDWVEPWVNHAERGVAFANLRQRNQFASLTNIGLAALWWWVRTQEVARWRAAAWWVACAAALALGNAMSSSRTGLVQLLLLSAYLWFQGPGKGSRPRSVLVAALVSYAVGAVLLPSLAGVDMGAHGILSRFGDDTPACASRLVLWSNVLHLIAQRPWGGWGWGELDFAHYVTLYDGPRFCDILDNAHNLPLQLAVELGLPVAVSICGAVAWLVYRARPRIQEANPVRAMAWGVLALIGIHSLLEYPLWYGPFQIACMLCVVLLRRSVPVPLRLQWVMRSVAVATLAALAYAAWDYRRISQIYLPPEARLAAYRDNTLEKIRVSRLFRRQVDFADLTTATLSPGNAQRVYTMASTLLHFSPEPRVIEKLVESATMLGRDDEALFHLVRFKAAFPDAHARWAVGLRVPS